MFGDDVLPFDVVEVPLPTHTEIFTPQVGKQTFWCTITPLWQVFKLGPVVIVHLFSRFQYHVGVY